MHTLNPALITLLQLWKIGSNSFAKKGKGKVQTLSSDDTLIQGQYLKMLSMCSLRQHID